MYVRYTVLVYKGNKVKNPNEASKMHFGPKLTKTMWFGPKLTKTMWIDNRTGREYNAE